VGKRLSFSVGKYAKVFQAEILVYAILTCVHDIQSHGIPEKHVSNYAMNTTNFMHASISLHFIGVQCLDMFRALLAHHQEALYERRIGDYDVQDDQSTSTTAHNGKNW
jgi:hypothetical protein